MLRFWVKALCILSLLLAGTGVASANSLSFVDLSAMASYGTANPCGVNSSGAVTGMYLASPSHIFLYTGGTAGTMNDLTSKFISSGGLISSAINQNGQIAVNRQISGWLYGGGLSGTVTALPGTNTGAMDINSNGDISGATGTTPAPIVYSGGTLYTLNRAYANVASYMLALNSNGQGVGFDKHAIGMDPAGMFATVWTYTISGGSVVSQSATDISPYLTTAYSSFQAAQAYAINNAGQVVGDWSSIYGSQQNNMTGAFLYDMSSHAVTSLPLIFTTQLGLGYLDNGQGENQLINDSGEVVGQITVGGVPHAADLERRRRTARTSTPLMPVFCRRASC